VTAPTVVHGDAREALADLDTASVDAIVTDPPYELGFMGKAWDGSGIAYDPALWAECLRVLKPGGHLAAFGGTRTYHRMTCAVEDAGFEIRDSLMWVYGSGFPKSLDVGKAIDATIVHGKSNSVGIRAANESRPGEARTRASTTGNGLMSGAVERTAPKVTRDTPATPEAARWQGWGTALKPAHEPIVLARKPLTGTVAANVLAHGTGALNVDGCRIVSAEPIAAHHGTNGAAGTTFGSRNEYVPGAAATTPPNMAGRWPANVVLDEHAAAALDAQTGTLTSGGANRSRAARDGAGIYAATDRAEPSAYITDQGGASRFFYCAKAPARERPKIDGIAHPTVKPLTLMRWLVRLVTPPGGLVLDPFAGSGTTLQAARDEGFRAIGVELDERYCALIAARLGEVAA
jgi:hypothetical protein